MDDFFAGLVDLSNIALVSVEADVAVEQWDPTAWYVVSGAGVESAVTRIAHILERDRLLALGHTIDGYSSRDDADAALEEAMLEGNMPIMHWFVVVPTAAGTAPVELLCTVGPDPPSRPDCDVYAFGADGEMARAHFTDYGGVHDDAADDADADDDALSSPCYSPPSDDHADSAGADRSTVDAGTPATLVATSRQRQLENTGSEQHYRVTEPDERTRLTKERQSRHWVVPGRPGNVQTSTSRPALIVNRLRKSLFTPVTHSVSASPEELKTRNSARARY